MKKKITVSLNEKGIDALIKEVIAYRKWLLKKTGEFVELLASEGCQIASVNFEAAQYDGTNDVSVRVEQREKGICAVVAVGNATLFIEFGTGITYPDNHPEASEHGMIRGQFGYRLGRLSSWRYKGDAGTNGQVISDGKHKGEIRTQGNPANMAMYNAVKEIEERFSKIAREVFK